MIAELIRAILDKQSNSKFVDYAIIGNAFRPLVDKWRLKVGVSRYTS